MVHFQRARFRESLPWFTTAIEQLQNVLKRDASVALARDRLVRPWRNRAEAYERLGDYSRAVDDWKSLADSSSAPEDRDYYRRQWAAACALAGRLERAGDLPAHIDFFDVVQDLLRRHGERYPNWEMPAHQRDDYPLAAVAMLKAGFESGRLKSREHRDRLISDATLEPLRTRDDFKALVRSVADRN